MKSILLTTTALVAFAGAAAADGHISVTWSGTATAGVAREGGSDAVSGAETIAGVLNASGIEVTAEELGELGDEGLLDDVAEDLLAGFTNEDGDEDAEAAALAATVAAATGSAAVETGDFMEYAEINTTVTGSVALDSGVTLSASMSVDAGQGYDFADDDGFDADNSFRGGFDNVTVDAGAYGTLVMAPNDIAHLVDDDDDGSADFKYTNDFGVASVAFVMDIDEDSDAEATAEAWTVVDTMPTEGTYADVSTAVGSAAFLTYTAPVAADVQWSAKVTAPVADIATVYAAIDEEGGYDVGASATVAGVSLNAKVKSEALAVAQDADPEFDISGSYTMSGLTVGAGWNSIEDGDQWRINGSYTMDAITVSASTDEGEDWEVTGSYDLGSGASIVAGVNYTEDAYVGVSFSF